MKYWKFCMIAFVVFASCDKILDQELVGDRSDESYWQSEQDLLDAVAGTYRAFVNRDLGMHDLFFDNASDDHWRAGDHADDEPIETFNTDPGNEKLLLTYQAKYEVISRANQILVNAHRVKENAAIDETSYQTIVGEAYFLRAYAYYRLFAIHGQVPLITEEEVMSNTYNVPKCSSLMEITDLIIADLEKSADMLPMNNQPGRVGKGAAWALLTTVYMHRAEEYADEINLSKARDFGQRVVDNYPLAEDYAAVFAPGNEYLPENLFIMMNDMEWIDEMIMSKHRGPRPWGAYGFQEPLQDLVDEFEAGDPRKEVTVIADGEQIWGGNQYLTHTPGLSSTGFSYAKYLAWREDGSFNHGLNIPFLRAADTYLLVAEAKIRLLGAGAGDDLINKVRSRVGLGSVSAGGMEEIMHETRVELAGENFRHQNLLRWDKAGVIDLVEFYARPEKMIPSDIGRRKFVRPRNYYYPLPQVEIDKSNNVLVQNPEYVF